MGPCCHGGGWGLSGQGPPPWAWQDLVPHPPSTHAPPAKFDIPPPSPAASPEGWAAPAAPQGQAPPGEQLLLYWGPWDRDVHPPCRPQSRHGHSWATRIPPPRPSTLHVGLLQQQVGGSAGLRWTPPGSALPIQPRQQGLGGFHFARGLLPGGLGAHGGHRGRLLCDVPPQHARRQPRPLGRPCRKGGAMVGGGGGGGTPVLGHIPTRPPASPGRELSRSPPTTVVRVPSAP